MHCGCGPQHAKRPHVAVVWRGAALEPVPALTSAACALEHDSARLLALVPHLSDEPVAARTDAWHANLSAAIGPVSGGRSASHAGPAGLLQAVQEAVCALELGDRVHGPGHMTSYAEIFVLDYAARLFREPRIGQLYERVPSRLQTFDQTENAELLPTLEAFLAEGSMHSAAERLNVHRNTVLYRLKRIEEVTGIDLGEPETRFLVHLALRAQRSMALRSA